MPAADAELEALKAELGTLAAPEQFYGENGLHLTHEASGTCLRHALLSVLHAQLRGERRAYGLLCRAGAPPAWGDMGAGGA